VTRITLRIDFDADRRLGPGKIRLLERIDETGSISAAARSMNMSYRRAWLLVDSLNRMFAEPVVAAAAGGARGGGAEVTPLGHRVVRAYRDMETRAAGTLERPLAILAEALDEPAANGHPASDPSP
jgi:molybdate transport system regulatory protein